MAKNGREPLKFFKVFISSSDDDDYNIGEKLPLPPKFVDAVIGEKGWEEATISSPLGKTWRVKMERDSRGSYCFGDGWGELVRAHDLQFGYFLLFDYEGDTSFSVTVFDHSACIRSYAPIATKIEPDDAEVETFNFPDKPNVPEAENPTGCALRQPEAPQRDSSSREKNSRRTILKRTQFKIVMKPSYFRKRETLLIPSKFISANKILGVHRAILSNPNGYWPVSIFYTKGLFARLGSGWQKFRYENKLKPGDACIFELQSKGKNAIRLLVTIQPEVPSQSRTEFVSSGKESLITSKSIAGAVMSSKESTGFSSRFEMQPCSQQMTVTSKPSRETQRRKLRGPNFEVTMKHHNLSGNTPYVRINQNCEAFDYLLDQHEVVLWDPKGKCWRVRIYHIPRHGKKKYHSLRLGWMAFCHGNKVEVGDVCIFELISKGPIAEMNVNISKKPTLGRIQNPVIRRNEINDLVDDEDCNLLKSLVSRPVVYSSVQKVDEEGNCKSNSHKQQLDRPKIFPIGNSDCKLPSPRGPQFIAIVKHRNLHGSPYLLIPHSFDSSKYLNGKKIVTLINRKEQQWSVNLYSYSRGNGVNYQFGRGWNTFHRVNNLALGDLCIFELVSWQKDVVMLVDVVKVST